MKRRRLLALTGSSLTIAASGCLGSLRLGEQSDSDGLSPEPTGEQPDHTDSLTQFQSDASNTGVVDGTAPETTQIRWETTLDPVDGGLAVSDGRLVIAAGGKLIALDTADGSVLWAVTVGLDATGPPALTADTAYVTTWNGGESVGRGLVAVDLADGTLRWRAVPTVDVSTAPTLADGTVYVGGSLNSESVIALDGTDGTEQWRFEAGQYASTPAVDDGTVYVGGGDRQVLYALAEDSGEERWRVKTDGQMWAAPTVVDGTVYAPSRSGRLYALATADGTEQWTVDIGSEVQSSVAVTEDCLYVSSRDRFVALDSAGTEQWDTNIERGHPPTVTDNAVVVAGGDAARCLDPTDGTERWRQRGIERTISDMVFAGIKTAPAIADGTVFVASHGGDLRAITANETA
jgi:outer membrane protein assembly factor BamB